jgi:hypothetical protein
MKDRVFNQLIGKIFNATERLWDSCIEEDLETAKKVIKYADVNNQDDVGWTPLHLATKKRSLEFIKLLFSDKRTDPNLKDIDGRTPLFIATMMGYVDAVKLFLENPKTDVNAADNLGYTPLSWICEKGFSPGHEEIAEMLLNDPRINVNAVTNFGTTPLILATYYGREKIVEMLLSKGADPNLIKSEEGSLAFVVLANRIGPKIEGYFVEEENEYGCFIGRYFIVEDVKLNSQRYVKIAKMLLDAGAEVTPKILKILEKHEKEEERFWEEEVKYCRGDLKEKAKIDTKNAIDEVKKMVTDTLEEKKLLSIREEGKIKIF